jgi:CheY-like chemotaxis protein
MKKTILIADDDPDVIDLLTLRCRKAGYEVVSASNAMAALVKIQETHPDFVILDYEMPNGNGLSVCEMMSHDEQLCSVPVVILTASCSEETIRRCHDLCAYYVLKCADMWSRIEPIIKEKFMKPTNSVAAVPSDLPTANLPESDLSLMDTVYAILGTEKESGFHQEVPEQQESGAETPQGDGQPWVLSIEDDDDYALALRLRLQDFGVQVLRASAGTEGYRRAFVEAPAAILLDYELPEGNGDYVLRRLKESPATRDIPVIVLTGRHEKTIERKMRGLGASEFFTKPFDWHQLKSALQRHIDTQSLGQAATELATTT